MRGSATESRLAPFTVTTVPPLYAKRHDNVTQGRTSLQSDRKFTRPACRAAAAAIDRYLLPAPDLSSKPAVRRCCCRSTEQTDGRTDGNIEIKRQRIRRKDEHVARDDLLTGRLRSRNKYPTVRARTNRFKNSYTSYATANYQ